MLALFGAASDSDDARATLDRAIAAEGEVQTRLPDGEPRPPRPGGPERSDDFGPRGVAGGESSVHLPTSDAVGAASKIALVVGIGLGVILLAVLGSKVNDALARRRGAVPVAPAAAAPPAAAPEDAIGDADALAREGRFAEAIRALLARTVDGVAARRGSPFRPALTSREVLSEAALAGAPRDALASLVLLVERTRFGGTPALASDFAAARDAAARVAA